MADTSIIKGQVCAKEKRIRNKLPTKVKITFKKACILCRRLPRIKKDTRDGIQSFYVSDGVFIPQKQCTFQGREVYGNYKLVNRWVYGKRIDVWHHKARGSRNHHKFLITITSGWVDRGNGIGI